MPLGYLISVESKYCDDIAESMKEEETDQIFAELYDMRRGSDEAVDTGRGHMFLDGYLLEHGHLDNVLNGKTLVRMFDDGSIITLNDKNDVLEFARELSNVDHHALGDLADAYHEQVPRHAPTHALRAKQGFFARLFGKPSPPAPAAQSEPRIDPSLIELFDEIKVFYVAASQDNKSVFSMVSI